MCCLWFYVHLIPDNTKCAKANNAKNYKFQIFNVYKYKTARKQKPLDKCSVCYFQDNTRIVHKKLNMLMENGVVAFSKRMYRDLSLTFNMVSRGSSRKTIFFVYFIYRRQMVNDRRSCLDSLFLRGCHTLFLDKQYSGRTEHPWSW